MDDPDRADVSRMNALPRDSAAEPFVLTGQQMLELAAARRACRPVSRAAHVARLSGWAIALFAGFTLVAGLAVISAMWMGLAMIIAAFVELRSCARLRRLDPSAARTLGYNQAVLGILIILYACGNIALLIAAPVGAADVSFNVSNTPLRFLPNHVLHLRQFEMTVYGGMAAVALLTQGAAACYYFSRDKWLRLYVSCAPAWILQLQRAGVRF